MGALIRIDRKAVRTANKEKFLPLHFAAYYGASLQVIMVLIMIYPEALDMKGVRLGTPRDISGIYDKLKESATHAIAKSTMDWKELSTGENISFILNRVSKDMTNAPIDAGIQDESDNWKQEIVSPSNVTEFIPDTEIHSNLNRSNDEAKLPVCASVAAKGVVDSGGDCDSKTSDLEEKLPINPNGDVKIILDSNLKTGGEDTKLPSFTSAVTNVLLEAKTYFNTFRSEEEKNLGSNVAAMTSFDPEKDCNLKNNQKETKLSKKSALNNVSNNEANTKNNEEELRKELLTLKNKIHLTDIYLHQELGELRKDIMDELKSVAKNSENRNTVALTLKENMHSFTGSILDMNKEIKRNRKILEYRKHIETSSIESYLTYNNAKVEGKLDSLETTIISLERKLQDINSGLKSDIEKYGLNPNEKSGKYGSHASQTDMQNTVEGIKEGQIKGAKKGNKKSPRSVKGIPLKIKRKFMSSIF